MLSSLLLIPCKEDVRISILISAVIFGFDSVEGWSTGKHSSSVLSSLVFIPLSSSSLSVPSLIHCVVRMISYIYFLLLQVNVRSIWFLLALYVCCVISVVHIRGDLFLLIILHKYHLAVPFSDTSQYCLFLAALLSIFVLLVLQIWWYTHNFKAVNLYLSFYIMVPDT